MSLAAVPSTLAVAQTPPGQGKATPQPAEETRIDFYQQQLPRLSHKKGLISRG